MTTSTQLIASEVKARADFVAIVSQYTSLRRNGRQYAGLCPFHLESNPSFYVEPQRKIWKCFGCGAGGDLFAFVMAIKGCGFLDALRIVAGFSSGVTRSSEPRSGERYRPSQGAEAPSGCEAAAHHSQSTYGRRARILAALDAADRRLRAIEATNRADSAVLATACEPDRVAVRHERA